jgi:transcriptional regulator with GAF, ATPase, and Fis domain
MDIVVRPRRGARDERYRNIQFLDTLGRTVEPELQGLPKRGPTLQLRLQDLQPKSRGGAAGSKPAAPRRDAERDAILSALRESAGVSSGPTGTAARLGLQRTTLHSKTRKLGIQRPSFLNRRSLGDHSFVFQP